MDDREIFTSKINPTARKTLAAFRLGNHKLAVETQGYVTPKIPYENRYCPLCSQETENEVHLLFKCNATCYKVEREKFIRRIVEMVKHFEHLSEQDKAFYIIVKRTNTPQPS